jgi:hypothetical protein
MNPDSSGVPDLLRRFVERPYAVGFGSGDAAVRIESNEFAIVSNMHSTMVSQSGFETEILNWRLIRDEQAPCDGKELTILASGAVSTLLAGTGTIIAIDHERREVLGFIAANVSAEEFVTSLLPVILKLSCRSVASSTVEQGA